MVAGTGGPQPVEGPADGNGGGSVVVELDVELVVEGGAVDAVVVLVANERTVVDEAGSAPVDPEPLHAEANAMADNDTRTD